MTPDAEQIFLRQHGYCVLATGRRDGSPQQCVVRYSYDGVDFIISTLHDRPQWLNSKRQPRVSLLVVDGRRYVLVYGRAEHIESDPARLDATRSRTVGYAEHVAAGRTTDELLAAALDKEKRVILRIVPERVLSHE